MPDINQQAKSTQSPQSFTPFGQDQGIQDSDINFDDLDLLLSSQDFQPEPGLQPTDPSFDAFATGSSALPEGYLPSGSNPDVEWEQSLTAPAPIDASTQLSLQLLTYRVQALETRFQDLET